jgi:hypothetical protein
MSAIKTSRPNTARITHMTNDVRPHHEHFSIIRRDRPSDVYMANLILRVINPV